MVPFYSSSSALSNGTKISTCCLSNIWARGRLTLRLSRIDSSSITAPGLSEQPTWRCSFRKPYTSYVVPITWSMSCPLHRSCNGYHIACVMGLQESCNRVTQAMSCPSHNPCHGWGSQFYHRLSWALMTVRLRGITVAKRWGGEIVVWRALGHSPRPSDHVTKKHFSHHIHCVVITLTLSLPSLFNVYLYLRQSRVIDDSRAW